MSTTPQHVPGEAAETPSSDPSQATGHEQLRFMQLLMDALPLPIFYKDRSGLYLGCNRAFEEFTGHRREDILGKTVYDLSPRDIADIYRKMDDELFATGGAQQYEWKWRRHDGEERDVIFNKAVFRDAAGQIAGLVGSYLDITEKKKMEQALIESDTRYRTLVDRLPAITYQASLSASSATTYISPQVKDILGYDPEQFIREAGFWFSRIHPEDRPEVEQALARVHAQGVMLALEYRLHARDGRVVWIRDEAVVVRDANGHPLFLQGLMYDVTERRQMEEDLQQLNRDLEQRVKERTSQLEETVGQLRQLAAERARLERLVYEIGEEERARIGRDIHDVLGQTLTALSMKGHVLLTRLSRQNRPEAEDARMLAETAQQAVTQARDLSHMLFPMELKDQNFAAAIEELCLFTETHFHRACLLEAVPPVMNLGLKTATHLYRIAQEAVTNAVKHSGARKISVCLKTEAGQGILMIRDNGHGLKPGAEKSTGRGLATMAYRARLIGAEFSLDSPPGRGATVCCRFPLQETPEALGPGGELDKPGLKS